MLCPLLCIRPDNILVADNQCLKEACSWWVTYNNTGACALCRIGEYAAKQ